MDDEAKVLIRAGDVEIDISGAQNSVDERLIRVKEDDTWSIALSRIRNARERAIEAAVDAARDAGLPERGSAFRALIENCSLIRKPDQVLDLCDEKFSEKINYKPTIICCFEVLEHTHNPLKAVENIFSILENEPPKIDGDIFTFIIFSLKLTQKKYQNLLYF